MSADIIIIGAGLAGLTAAIELQKAGNEVVVLESSDLPGGRIATDHSSYRTYSGLPAKN